MKKEADYDTIGGLFENFTDTAAQRAVEIRTLMHMAGDVEGLHVLDLACGYGFFGRELLKKGAASVVGVDISAKMIELAQEESRKQGDNIEFHVRNVCELESLGQFDMVMAAWLFNYAESLSDLQKMFQAVARNLKPGGRLVAYTVEPDFQLSQGNFTTYGVHVRTEEPWQGGFRHQAEFVTTPPSPFTFFRWSRQDYEQAIAAAGLSQVHWQKPLLLESDIKRYTPGFWDTFQNNCLQTGLNCRH
ncbi:class I SAM-dependent methyltransferase [Pseudomonas sp. 5P_3.1_Bac2]|uniref:class I SAM-dependent methyltransferase n=1 Tax=Pseudomonas sp. 5P_3.1_Bac2 TaxID=2971617 RepID=UPI0021C7C2F9|nr:class I SAM-dependent methyltransferase [Pseudomonas sp. 5P_3.1_Bac2]MCU1718138.1 class I SAM-dependent methyltransferase [Pseudomonas sp. 5P_3.1_Bac2]